MLCSLVPSPSHPSFYLAATGGGGGGWGWGGRTGNEAKRSVHALTSHPATLVYPVVAALRGSVQEEGDVGKREVLQGLLPPVLVLLVP